MISQRMPRIRLGSNISFDEIGQALAFTYLSQYSGQAMQPRVLEAYSRAWGTDTVINFARVDATNPGATMSLWEGESLRHCLVGIHGIESVPSLLDLNLNYGFQTVAGCTGTVFTPFASRAASLWTRLHANARFAGVVASNRYVVTFSGHSLGAAMAEILAYRFKAAYPWKQVRCIKFGSPRVGTRRWHANKNPNVKFLSCYSNTDPVHRFPFVPVSLTAIDIIGDSLGLGNFVRDEEPWRMRPDPWHFGNTYAPLLADGIQAVGAAFGSHTPNNVWFDHHLGAYRLQFMNIASTRTDALKYRFNYLEHNDENQWQKLYTPGQREYAFMNVLDPIQPDPTPPISTDVALIVNAPPAMQQVAPIIPDWQSVISGGDSDWGQGVPVPSAILPRRISRRPTQ